MREESFRRHTESVSKRRAERVLRSQGYHTINPTIVGIRAHSPAICSCYACGNARKNHGMKISEQRARASGMDE